MSSSNGSKKSEYEVGYGKPPKHAQWQPGQSGNPTGKKKKDESLLEKVKKLGGEEIVVHKGGQKQVISNLDAVAHALLAKAQSGHIPAIKILIDLNGEEAVMAASAMGYDITPADLAVLEIEADWQVLLEKAKLDAAAAVDEAEEGSIEDDEPDTAG
ncbi:DUF5681 domain-containing protein [Ruegeria arenilitoris]|uniref:DUF5681 domain-containing protein n=1 Tax=Ruegeria arenilitoris TaxID=1173585 RepID=UPI001480EB78|nr:DUF5681 domain-containing protein [Ruegeria arenilitoris]